MVNARFLAALPDDSRYAQASLRIIPKSLRLEQHFTYGSLGKLSRKQPNVGRVGGQVY